MLKRIIVVLTVLSFALAPASAKDKKPINSLERIKDNRTQVLVPGTGRVMPLNLAREMIRDDGNLEIVRIKTRHEGGPASIKPYSPSAQAEVLWSLTHADDNAEYYLGSGAAGDTFAVVFTAAAPAIVTEVYQQWFTAGNVIAFGALYGDGAAAVSPDGQCQDIERGDLPIGDSPIGKMMTTPTPNTVPAVSDYSELLDIGGTFMVGDSNAMTADPFVIVFIKGDVTPHPLADATDDQGGITYTWFGGPWTDSQWAPYSYEIENMCLVKVTYPWGAPIAFQSVNQIPNTYATTATRTVEMDLFDDIVGGVAIDANDTLIYHYVIYEPGASSVAYSGNLVASTVGAEGNGIYTFDIDLVGVAVGTVVEYWGTTKDETDLESESVHLDFEVLQPSYPDADLLIVADAAGSQEDYALYEKVAMDNDIVYEYWNASENHGIDATVINHGWGTIVVFGWGTKTVPAVIGEDDPGYGAFLDGGGNLLLVDQDWFYGHGFAPSPTFGTGDFAFDYFGIAAGVNDPADGDGNSTGDTVLVGEGVTPIDSPFSTNSLVLNHNIYGTTYWTDYLTAGTATSIFLGDVSGNTVGTAYDNGTYKAVYLAFMADAGVDTTAEGDLDYSQFATLLEGAFTYFGVISPPMITGVTDYDATTAIAGSYGVSALIVDADGDLGTVELFFSSDTGATWDSLAMTAVVDTFSADLPLLTDSEWYFYYVKAEDASSKVNTYPNAAEDALEFFYFKLSGADVLYVDDTGGNGPYYGLSDAYHDALTVGGVSYDTYDIDDLGLPDTSVFRTANFSTIIWNTEVTGGSGFAWTTADNPLNAFITGGGNLLLTGDEALGTEYDWPGTRIGPFEAGDVGLDFFGLADAMSDGENSDGYLFGVSGDPITGGFGATDTLWYNTFFTEWSDGLITEAAIITATNGIGVDTSFLDDGDTVFTAFDTTVVTSWTTWYGTRFNSGTHKAVFLPIYASALDSADWGEILDSTFSWFDATGSPTEVAGILGPELAFEAFTVDITAVDTVAVVVAISERDRGIPTEFALSQNYPNPFNPETTIQFGLPENGEVLLTVYNMLGQEVVRLVEGELSAGYHIVRWNAVDAHSRKVPSGVYFYRIQSGSNVQTMKMLLLK